MNDYRVEAAGIVEADGLGDHGPAATLKDVSAEIANAKKYQVLDSHEESPTLPLGYPASILLSFVPPLWFRVMNPRIPEEMKAHLAHD